MSDRLQNAAEARVETGKVSDYLLSLDHPEGRGKAAFFIAFGFERDRLNLLVQALLRHATTQPVVDEQPTPYGRKFTLECSVESPDSRNPCIRSVWIIEDGETAPRLVTAYPNGEKRSNASQP